jgi:hypothetical protein
MRKTLPLPLALIGPTSTGTFVQGKPVLRKKILFDPSPPVEPSGVPEIRQFGV